MRSTALQASRGCGDHLLKILDGDLEFSLLVTYALKLITSLLDVVVEIAPAKRGTANERTTMERNIVVDYDHNREYKMLKWRRT